MIRLGPESFCCGPGSFIPQLQKRVAAPIPHFPPPSIYFTTLPVRRRNSCAPFSLCCFDCSSFFIAPPAALRGLAICTVTGALRMWVMGLLPVVLPAATAGRGKKPPLSICLLTPELVCFLPFFLSSSSLTPPLILLQSKGGEGGWERHQEKAVMHVCMFFPSARVCVYVYHAGVQLINPCSLRVWVYSCTSVCVSLFTLTGERLNVSKHLEQLY